MKLINWTGDDMIVVNEVAKIGRASGLKLKSWMARQVENMCRFPGSNYIVIFPLRAS